MSSNSTPSKRGGGTPPRGGNGRGRGRGGGRRSGRGRGGRRPNERSSNGSGNVPQEAQSSEDANGGSHFLPLPELRDEEVLIAFMPYMKGDNEEAMHIHEHYQSSNDQKGFLRAAREFLSREQSVMAQTSHALERVISTPSESVPEFIAPTQPSTPFNRPNGNLSPNPFGHIDSGNTDGMAALERDMMGLMADDDPVVAMPSTSRSIGRPTTAIGGNAIGSSPANLGALRSSMFDSVPSGPPSQSRLFPQHTPHPVHYGQAAAGQSMMNGSPGRFAQESQSPFSSLFPPSPSSSVFIQDRVQPPPGAPTWPTHVRAPAGLTDHPDLTPERNRHAKSPLMTPTSPSIRPRSAPESPATVPAETPQITAKKEYQPKRLWTRLDEQPGKILANNVDAAVGTVVDLRPRQEVKAQWVLPLAYLRHHASEKPMSNDPSRDLLDGLAVGLFRRGCTENGSQASIVSKEILSNVGESRSDYPIQFTKDAVMGTVPFFSPRTPGHVVFRLYWQDDPLHTLATGPTLNVRVTERDFESTIRFILSNFKAKKMNPTSLSSLNSLSLVLDQFQLPPSHHSQRMAQQMEGAGRAVWGCICEARKVLDACAADYEKTTSKLEKLEEVVEELKAKVDGEEQEKREAKSTDDTVTTEEELSETFVTFRDKEKALMSGRASCERKWRDSQLAFASILKAVVANPSMSVILRRELIAKLRLEYELWCPLSEEFAVPGDGEVKLWYEALNHLPHNVNEGHFRKFAEARSQMQHKSLGFDPNIKPLESILYPTGGRNSQMRPSAVNVFNQLSAAMGQLYQDSYATADHILRQREMIRMRLESLVGMCDCFPPGTSVAIFGSSANGFGSPKSDLDMCLQIPPGYDITDADDPTGGLKMSKLAKVLEENGMKEVDTCRLTARIPVIKFYCPKPLENGRTGEEALLECDLSMHNPLAVLNTSLLRTYSEINPVPRVLAAVIKRWTKARDINNPAKHTLSSYGYILMLLHFLTFHQRSGQGLVSSASQDEKGTKDQALPLLPNLQWMDGKWPEAPQGTPYKEYNSLPKNALKHPLEERASVNAHFYRPNNAMLQNLQRLFPGQDLSLGILLASFFRYYAYEFDYKRFVVSLHSTLSHGLVEREVKAELDGWRNYSAALTIEDPFETFYDVAHVLRGGYYHRIRREFAVAYSKIADVASGKANSVYNNVTVDLTKMVGMELIDWICEPVAAGDDASF